MMAANYRHIGGGENRLGRHYSRFAGVWPTSFLADQSLTLRKSQNTGSNRSSRANVLARPQTRAHNWCRNGSVPRPRRTRQFLRADAAQLTSAQLIGRVQRKTSIFAS